jgi:hypothetical protein
MTTRATLYFGVAMALIASGCGDSSAVSPAHPGSTDADNQAAASPVANPGTGSLTAARENHDVLSVLSVEHQVDIATDRDGLVVSIARDEGSAVRLSWLRHGTICKWPKTT